MFSAIEAAYVTAVKKHFGEEADISVTINRKSGQLTAACNGRELDEEEIGRIGAQTAKQVIIQKVKELNATRSWMNSVTRSAASLLALFSVVIVA